MLIHGLSSVGSIRGEMLSEEIASILQNKENSTITLESRSKVSLLCDYDRIPASTFSSSQVSTSVRA